MRTRAVAAVLLAASAFAGAVRARPTVLAGGLIVDGSGEAPYAGWLAMDGDRITGIGKGAAPAVKGATVINVQGQAIAPGFINMLSWATESLLVDGRALSDLKQGITLEVMGEGESMGPWNDAMKALDARRQGDIKYQATWTSLGEYLNHLEQRGIAVNVASFVGAATVRVHELGENNVQPTQAQLARMQGLVRAAMHEGAMGVGSSLIYTPGNYAKTAELTALMQAAAPCGGVYISHIRNEGPTLEAALEEIIAIAQASGARAEIYHMKQAGRANWGKYDAMVARIEAARAAGVQLTADMYTYAASSTGLDASMPLWVQEGGIEAWTARMKDPAVRARVIADMRNPPAGETNSMAEAGGPDKVLLLGFKTAALKALTGKTLAEVAASRGTSAEDTAIDLVIEDGSRIQVAYFSMNEANVKKQIALPWMSFASDASAQAPEGVFLKSSTHPRAYGNFARVLGKYVREEKVISLAEAVRKLSAQPADNLRIAARGRLKPGNFADVVVFDPATIADRATFAQPQQLAVGVGHVWVNGVQVLKDGEPTGAAAGRFVKGPGAGKCPA
ncbi:MAG: N-acyl-D-amino-acid deacylase family protein [Sandarakinorhabdus sp.]